MGDFIVHTAGSIDIVRGQLCSDCGKTLPMIDYRTWPEGTLVGLGDWYGATPYVASSKHLASNERRCSDA